MSAHSKTNGKQKASGSPPVIKTYRYTGSDRSINTLREQAKRWSGGKVTWRIVPDDPQKYTLMGTPGNCDAFHAGVKQLCDERNHSTKGKGREDRRDSQNPPKGKGREFRSESQPKPKARGREDRRDSQNPPKGKGRRDRSFSPPPRSRQGRKEPREKSFSPPPRRRHGGCKGARDRSVSPPLRRRGMYSNPYAPQREVNPYAPQREVNPYAPHRGAGNFEVGALSENVESITITTVTYKFVSKPKHTNPHADIGSDEWMKWELDWNSGYC